MNPEFLNSQVDKLWELPTYKLVSCFVTFLRCSSYQPNAFTYNNCNYHFGFTCNLLLKQSSPGALFHIVQTNSGIGGLSISICDGIGFLSILFFPMLSGDCSQSPLRKSHSLVAWVCWCKFESRMVGAVKSQLNLGCLTLVDERSN